MRITTRQYPYPVLSELTDNYNNANFTADLKQKVDGEDIVLDINFKLNCKILEQMIQGRVASYVVHIECPATRYRSKIVTYESRKIIKITGTSLKNKVELSIFIVAQQQVDSFESQEFNQDFEGINFKLEQGDILAFDYNRILNITKTGDALKKVPSIFRITSLDENNKSSIDWEDTGERILIKLSKDNYTKYKELIENQMLEGILSMTIVVPVLIEILCDLKQDAEAYEDSAWYTVILNRLQQLKINNIEKLSNESSMTQLAYKILDGIMENCLIDLEEMEVERWS